MCPGCSLSDQPSPGADARSFAAASNSPWCTALRALEPPRQVFPAQLLRRKRGTIQELASPALIVADELGGVFERRERRFPFADLDEALAPRTQARGARLQARQAAHGEGDASESRPHPVLPSALSAPDG